MSSDAWLTFGGVCAFSLVWLGLLRNITAIARRNRLRSGLPELVMVLGANDMTRAFAGPRTPA